MKVGVCEAQQLKERGEKLGLTLADTLLGYMIEDALLRIYGSPYGEYLWLESREIFGAQAYQKRAEEAIRFLYQPAERAIAPEKLCPGQKLSVALCEEMVREIFAADNAQQISWSGKASETNGIFCLHLTGSYKEMQVPLCLTLHSVEAQNQRPGKREKELTVLGHRKLTYYVYAPENRLSKDLFEIVDKLELVGDMGCYSRVYQVLCREPLSGRYVLEELNALTEACPKVRNKQRLTQLAEYESYAYMRKRWERYTRSHDQRDVAWIDVVHLILNFLTPVWESLCENAIFFDDWMPELGRFLG